MFLIGKDLVCNSFYCLFFFFLVYSVVFFIIILQTLQWNMGSYSSACLCEDFLLGKGALKLCKVCVSTLGNITHSKWVMEGLLTFLNNCTSLGWRGVSHNTAVLHLQSSHSAKMKTEQTIQIFHFLFLIHKVFRYLIKTLINNAKTIILLETGTCNNYITSGRRHFVRMHYRVF